MTDAAVQFRKAFRADRIAFIREHGVMAFDQARSLYTCRKTGEKVIFSDAFYGDENQFEIGEFIDHLTRHWWGQRALFKSQDEGLDLELTAGIYAHFLPEVGFDYTVEFADEGPVRCWRVDASGRAGKLSVPSDEATFHGQTGTYFDLRAGWRSLFKRYEADARLVVEEVEPGYFIGVRPGVPGDGDPASRHDPELEHAFSTRVEYGFDTIEFLESAEALLYPIETERYSEWLVEWKEAIQGGQHEPFVLADSNRFIGAIEELCELRHITPEFVSSHESMSCTLSKGPIHLKLDLGDLFLRCLHTARTFSAGARSFVVPSADMIDDAFDLYLALSERLNDFKVGVHDGAVLVVHGPQGEVGRWNLLNFAGRISESGRSYTDAVLRLMGFDPETNMPSSVPISLDKCPVCGDAARVEKVIRPTTALGVDPRTLVGVPIGEHTVYFTLDCPLHTTPLQPQPGFSLQDYEDAYQAGLQAARVTIVHQETLPQETPGDLIVGYGVGSFVLEPSRIRGVLAALDQDTTEERCVYGLFPDALIVAQRPLTEPEQTRARSRAHEVIARAFPDRSWPLEISRKVDLDTPAAGVVDFLST